jgi:hypothetical protein
MTDTARLRELAGKLLPCPFCGQSLFYSVERSTWQHPNWPCPAKSMAPFRSDDAEAIAAWNRRALLDELDASKARAMTPKPDIEPVATQW